MCRSQRNEKLNFVNRPIDFSDGLKRVARSAVIGHRAWLAARPPPKGSSFGSRPTAVARSSSRAAAPVAPASPRRCERDLCRKAKAAFLFASRWSVEERAMLQSEIRRYLKHGTLPQLRAFEASARLGSVTRAAQELHMAQATASVQLKKLSETV